MFAIRRVAEPKGQPHRECGDLVVVRLRDPRGYCSVTVGMKSLGRGKLQRIRPASAFRTQRAGVHYRRAAGRASLSAEFLATIRALGEHLGIDLLVGR